MDDFWYHPSGEHTPNELRRQSSQRSSTAAAPIRSPTIGAPVGRQREISKSRGRSGSRRTSRLAQFAQLWADAHRRHRAGCRNRSTYRQVWSALLIHRFWRRRRGASRAQLRDSTNHGTVLALTESPSSTASGGSLGEARQAIVGDRLPSSGVCDELVRARRTPDRVHGASRTAHIRRFWSRANSAEPHVPQNTFSNHGCPCAQVLSASGQT